VVRARARPTEPTGVLATPATRRFMAHYDVFACVFLGWLSRASADAVGQGAGAAAVPAVHVQYEFAARDTTGSGPEARAFEELRGLRRRLARVVDEAGQDAESISTFAAIANRILDDSHEAPSALELSKSDPFGDAGIEAQWPGQISPASPLERIRRDPALDAAAQASFADALRQQISELVPRVDAGGRKARDALVRLLHEAPGPNAKEIMKAMGVQAAAARLMKSPASDAELQRLAGSMLTVLTGMPVSSAISEDSGALGQINVVLPRASRVYRPDRTMLAFRAGATPHEAIRVA